MLADTYTLTSFLTDVDAAITTLNNTGTIEISGQLGSVHDASDDVFSEYNSRTGSETLYINQAPDMLYFDNVSYYDLNGDTVFGSDPLTSQVSSSMYSPESPGSYSSTSPSETTLVGEFRIKDVDSATAEWSFDAVSLVLVIIIHLPLIMLPAFKFLQLDQCMI